MVELEPWLKSTFGETDEEEEEEGHLKGCIQCSRLLLQVSFIPFHHWQKLITIRDLRG